MESLPKMKVAERRKIRKLGGLEEGERKQNNVEEEQQSCDTMEKVEKVTGSDLASVGVSQSPCICFCSAGRVEHYMMMYYVKLLTCRRFRRKLSNGLQLILY